MPKSPNYDVEYWLLILFIPVILEDDGVSAMFTTQPISELRFCEAAAGRFATRITYLSKLSGSMNLIADVYSVAGMNAV
ncbi:MAG: hypothetical protein ACH344_04555 [Yersinia sp. (in: enterobacteria)]